MEKVAGHLEVGTSGDGEVIVNHPKMQADAAGEGHVVFSPKQARELARILEHQADAAEQEQALKTAILNVEVPGYTNVTVAISPIGAFIYWTPLGADVARMVSLPADVLRGISVRFIYDAARKPGQS